jgi:hypothetical protein
MLALATPAEAKIVYTPANKHIPGCDYPKKCLKLDLNHDGIADFRFPFTGDGHGYSLGIIPAGKTKNQIWGTISTVRCSSTKTCKYPVASALSSGVSVGPNSVKFQPGHFAMWVSRCESFCTKWGKWGNVKNKYLGLEFYIKGKVHYGWARLNVNVNNVPNARLTGYAYETIPNKPVITGQTKRPDVTTVQPGSLGRLSRGSAGR